jgi:ribosome-associated translation inhibitor RaiA
MKVPLQITFRAVPRSDAIVNRIMHHVAKLEAHCDSIVSCHVTIDAPHRQKAHGRHYAVRIAIGVPGRELVVSRDPAERREREDAYTSVDEAFIDARRLVATHTRRRAA